MNTEDFRKLEVWKLAHELVLDIYAVAKKLPESDQEFGIAAEICETAIQVPAGVARSCAFDEGAEFRECMEEARMSLRQTDVQLMVLRDMGHLSESECDRLLQKGEEVRALLIKRQSSRKKARKT